MSQILLVFAAGLLGVFLSMAVLYGSMRITAWAITAWPSRWKRRKRNPHD